MKIKTFKTFMEEMPLVGSTSTKSGWKCILCHNSNAPMADKCQSCGEEKKK